MEPSFQIFKLDAATIDEIVADPPAPHRHEYEELVVILDGNPEHFIDFHKQTVTAPLLIYVSKGKIHQFMPDKNTRGWLIQYQNEFIPQTNFHFYSHFADSIHYSFPKNSCHSKLDTLCSMMYDEFNETPPKLNIIKHLLSALLAQLETDRTSQLEQEQVVNGSYLATFNQFLKILETTYKQPESVQFYADQLNTSPRNLNLICQTVFNKSVSEIVETRRLIEAKQLLISTNQSVSEIGYKLGYNEKSYFSRVFAKKEGVTPTEFRTKALAALT
jgi:AraC-like DNA-binding protein